MNWFKKKAETVDEEPVLLSTTVKCRICLTYKDGSIYEVCGTHDEYDYIQSDRGVPHTLVLKTGENITETLIFDEVLRYSYTVEKETPVYYERKQDG